MAQVLQPDSSYWDIFEHIEKVSTFVETVGSLSPAKAALFGFLFLIPLLWFWSMLLKQIHISDENKKWWFVGFIISYVAILIFVKIDSEKTFQKYSLKKRVLNEMVFRMVFETDAKSLCQSLELEEVDLSELAQREAEYFHYRKDDSDRGQFNIVNAEILAAIETKRNDLEEAIAAEEIIPIDSIKARAINSNFGNISTQVITDIVSQNEDLVYANTGTYEIIEHKKANLTPFAELPTAAQDQIANAKFDPNIIATTRLKYPRAVANPLLRVAVPVNGVIQPQ